MNKYARVISFVWLAICIVVGFVGCSHKLRELSAPAPITKSNQPSYFYTIAFDKNAKPLLMRHEIALDVMRTREDYKTDAEFKAANNDVVWLEDNHKGGPHSFYIAKDKVESVQKILTKKIGDPLQSITINLLKDNPHIQAQTVFVDHWCDDSNFYFVYEVRNGRITPLKYGELTKHQGAQAAVIGTKIFVPAYLIGWVVLQIAFFVEKKRRR